jgi:hypothetical protein
MWRFDTAAMFTMRLASAWQSVVQERHREPVRACGRNASEHRIACCATSRLHACASARELVLEERSAT